MITCLFWWRMFCKNVSMDTSDIQENTEIYSAEELEQIAQLLDTILAIRQRLFAEGIDVDARIKDLQDRDSVVLSRYENGAKRKVQK